MARATVVALPSSRGALDLPDQPLIGAAWYPEQWPEQRGEANVFIGAESRKLAAPAIAFVPPRTEHWVENALADRDLQYLYISVWPNGIPSEEFNGGWKHVYAGIIDEYVTRGFPIDGKK